MIFVPDMFVCEKDENEFLATNKIFLSDQNEEVKVISNKNVQ